MLREVQARYEEECRAKQVAHDNLISADRRAHANQVAGGRHSSKVFVRQNWSELVDLLLQYYCTTVKPRLNYQRADTERPIYYRKYIMQIPQPSQYKHTKFEQRFAVISEAPSTFYNPCQGF
mgnify:CR=1 FL=1